MAAVIFAHQAIGAEASKTRASECKSRGCTFAKALRKACQARAKRLRLAGGRVPWSRPLTPIGRLDFLSACARHSAFVRRRESRPLHFTPSPQPSNVPSAPTRFPFTFLFTSLHCDGPFQADRSCSPGRRFVATTSSAACFQLHPAALVALHQRHYSPPCPPWITRPSRVRMTVSPLSHHRAAQLPAMTRC